MAKVELKQPIIDEIKSLLDGAVSVTAVKYIGLTVEQDTQLRKQLREAGVTYKVFKNTLIKRATEGTDFAQLDEVLDEVASQVTADTVVVSILAGVTAEYYAKRTVDGAKVVLVMPNTPFLLGEGATALSRSETVTDEEFELVCNIFSSGGISKIIDKDKMKEIIAINGSSPAFIYLYTKYFVDYATSVGIDEQTAKDLFAKSLIGSAKMITDSGKSLDELIEMVSSKGGTTIAGLEKLREGGLCEAVDNCCKACTKRAYELSK